MIIRMPGCWPIQLNFSTAHWHRHGTFHGSRSHPTLFAASFVKLNVYEPSIGRRLWLYFRGGYALKFDLYIDRRSNTSGVR